MIPTAARWGFDVENYSIFRSNRGLSQDELDERRSAVLALKPGERYTYWTGFLMADCYATNSTQTWPVIRELRALLMNAWERGEVELFQIRREPFVYDYVAIKRRRKTNRMWM